LAKNRKPVNFRPMGPGRNCQVETYSGSRLHERPRRFTWEGQWLEVGQVLATWYEPQSLNFQVAAGDGRIFLLQYDPEAEAWTVQPGRRE
jgi:hypothetical protein